jgi:hypothetical protein
MFEITTLKLKFTNNTMVCVQTSYSEFEYFSAAQYGSISAAQKQAHKFVKTGER